MAVSIFLSVQVSFKWYHKVSHLNRKMKTFFPLNKQATALRIVLPEREESQVPRGINPSLQGQDALRKPKKL